MSLTKEYDNTCVQSGPHAYVTLNTYNQLSGGFSLPEPDIPYTTSKPRQVINRLFPFESLVKGAGCGGYASIVSAYTYGNKKDEDTKCDPRYLQNPC